MVVEDRFLHVAAAEVVLLHASGEHEVLDAVVVEIAEHDPPAERVPPVPAHSRGLVMNPAGAVHAEQRKSADIADGDAQVTGVVLVAVIDTHRCPIRGEVRKVKGLVIPPVAMHERVVPRLVVADEEERIVPERQA